MAPSAKLRAGVARCAKGAAHADVKAVQKFVGFGHGFDPPPPIKSFRRLAAVLFVLALAVVAVQAHGDVRASFRLGKGLEVLNLGMGFDHLDLPRGAPGWRARWAGPEYGGGAAAEAAMSAALYFAHADYLKSLREASRKGQSTLLYVALILLGFALVVWHAGATKREAA
ncbi:hypothetical protein M885DRAFT_498799 [Pelagophyceae sp. CCMP2097]|nr:hypothetical protein M885DRAFT_498799 [Pelagophyceae sp. CCMP2097]